MSLIIMIKINTECVSKCFLYRLNQTDSKYGDLEVLVHTDDVSKHRILLMWKVLEKKKVFFLSKILLKQIY